MPAPAYVTSQITSNVVSITTPHAGGFFVGSVTYTYALGAGNSLMLMLIADGLDFFSITDTGGNTWSIDTYNLGSAVVSVVSQGLATTSITVTFQSATSGSVTAQMIWGEYANMPLNRNGTSYFGSSPSAEIIVWNSASPPAGIRENFSSSIGSAVFAGFLAVGNFGESSNITFLGPDPTYGGTMRQKVENHLQNGTTPMSFALVDELGGHLGLSETLSRTTGGSAWGAFSAAFTPPITGLRVEQALILMEMPVFPLGAGTQKPVDFNLQKLIVSVKESNIPVRGRNQ